MKTNVFLDMDGVLAEYHPETVKYMYDKRYFAERPTQDSMLDVARLLIKDKNLNVFVLSSILSDNKYAADEKDEWLDKYLPELTKEMRIYVKVGESKADKVKLFEGTKVLLDDFTENLIDWELKGNLGIKVINNLNNTTGRWVKENRNTIDICDKPIKSYMKVKHAISTFNMV